VRIRRWSKSAYPNRWKSKDLKNISKQKGSFGKAVQKGPELGASGILVLAVPGMRDCERCAGCWAEGPFLQHSA